MEAVRRSHRRLHHLTEGETRWTTTTAAAGTGRSTSGGRALEIQREIRLILPRRTTAILDDVQIDAAIDAARGAQSSTRSGPRR
eukprot:7454637-Heterocapsa_arctica.AAC.1